MSQIRPAVDDLHLKETYLRLGVVKEMNGTVREGTEERIEIDVSLEKTNGKQERTRHNFPQKIEKKLVGAVPRWAMGPGRTVQKQQIRTTVSSRGLLLSILAGPSIAVVASMGNIVQPSPPSYAAHVHGTAEDEETYLN